MSALARLSDEAMAAFLSVLPDKGTVLEFGSGESTRLLLAKGYKVVCLEHDEAYLYKCPARYVYSSLVNGFYSTEAVTFALACAVMENDFCGVIVDGPKKAHGARRGRAEGYLGKLRGLPVLIDDTNRRQERFLMRACKRAGWRTHAYGFAGSKKWNLMMPRKRIPSKHAETNKVPLRK